MSLLFVLTTLHLLLLVRVRSAGKNTLRQTENEKLGSLHKDRHQPEPEDQKVLLYEYSTYIVHPTCPAVYTVEYTRPEHSYFLQHRIQPCRVLSCSRLCKAAAGSGHRDRGARRRPVRHRCGELPC
jgi:hypothetical protein